MDGEVEVDEQKFLLKANAEGNLLERDPIPGAQETLIPSVQSTASDLAAGLLAAGKHLQARLLQPFEPFKACPSCPFTLHALCASSDVVQQFAPHSIGNCALLYGNDFF